MIQQLIVYVGYLVLGVVVFRKGRNRKDRKLLCSIIKNSDILWLFKLCIVLSVTLMKTNF